MKPPGAPRPPVVWRVLLAICVRGRGAEAAVGDLVEEFARRVPGAPPGDAGSWFARQALSLIIAWWSPAMRRARRRVGARRGAATPPLAPPQLTSGLARDVRYATRAIFVRPGVSLVIAVTLALGIGANAAIFSFVNGILLRDLPFPDPDELVYLHAADDAAGERYLPFAFQEVAAFRDRVTALREVAAYSMARQAVAGDAMRPAVLPYARVSDGFFQVLGTPPLIGRGFTAEEYALGSEVAVLSYGLWATSFGGNRAIVGSTITLDGARFTVVGVMPPDFRLPTYARLWRPMSQWLRQDDDREMAAVGRLAPGASVQEAATRVTAVARALAAAGDPADAMRTAWVEPAHRSLVRDIRAPLQLLVAAAGLVLLIACANVASLLLALGERRRHEIAVRVALGAGRGRLVRQSLVESGLLSVVGAVLGVVVGYAALPILIELTPAGTPRLDEVALDAGVVAMMMALAVVAGLGAGLVPALRASRLAPSQSLSRAGTRASSGRGTRRLQAGLIVAELALATVLIFGAGLFTATYRGLTSFDRGFDVDDVLVLPLSPSAGIAESAEGGQTFFSRVLETVEATPGVRAAGLAYHSPSSGRGLNLRFLALDGLAAARDARGSLKPVTPGFFATAGIGLIEGRLFTATDRRGAPNVAIVNESFARAYLAAREPIGATFTRASSDPEAPVAIEVVGVVEDITPVPGEPPLPIVYLPYDQLPTGYMELMVRYAGDAETLLGTLRDRIWALDPAMALNQAHTVESVIGASVASPRFHMVVVGMFAVLAVVVACVGVYGMLSFAVSSQNREIGIRRALGADAVTVVATVVARGGHLALLGAVIGLAVAAAAGRVVRGFLFGVAPFEPLVVVATVAALLLVAVAGSLAPALRAARVSPITAVRMD